jgi:hypothetical protein
MTNWRVLAFATEAAGYIASSVRYGTKRLWSAQYLSKYSSEQRYGGNTSVVFYTCGTVITRSEEAKLSYSGKGFCGFPAPERIATNQD